MDILWLVIGTSVAFWCGYATCYVFIVMRAERTESKRVCDEQVGEAYQQACDNMHRMERERAQGHPPPPS